jgi:hypothetical protein
MKKEVSKNQKACNPGGKKQGNPKEQHHTLRKDIKHHIEEREIM